jgi:hypothetical protein
MKLAAWGRPVVEFNPSNSKHREWFYRFMETQSWGHCPVRFYVNSEGEQIAVIQRLLLEYYLGNEFRKIERIDRRVA